MGRISARGKHEMYFRCGDCLASSWVELIQPGGAVKTVPCAECGRSFVLQPDPELKRTVRDHYRRTLELAERHRIDQASAYSVLLGIMDPDQAEVLRPRESAEAVAQTNETALFAGLDLDLAFVKAIKKGRLTLREAMNRGDRESYAARIARQHGLSMRLAYKVTDNAVSLRDALEQTRPSDSKLPPKPPASRASPLQRLIMLVMVSGVLVMVTRGLWIDNFRPGARGQVTTLPARPAQQEQVAPLRQAVLRASTQVSTDETGRPVGIEGPDPTSVLIAFCESGPSEIKLEPIEITSTVPAFREARLGLFRSYAEFVSLHAIRIRKDGRTNRWVAGDGRSPIRVIPAPELPSDAQRVRVENR